MIKETMQRMKIDKKIRQEEGSLSKEDRNRKKKNGHIKRINGEVR